MHIIGDISHSRILVKISGEALASEEGDSSLGANNIKQVAEGIAAIHRAGSDICLVVGGGNIVRGTSLASTGIDRATADYMGMLATIINAIALQEALEKQGISCRVMSAIPMTTVCEPYIRRKAIRHMEKRRIVIFAAGTGNPFFSTDTAAVLRAVEMNCNIILKGTKVDGVYSNDPKTHADATHYHSVSYNDVIARNLKVMDTAAIALAKDNNLPIVVFALEQLGNLTSILDGKQGKYTVISH